MNDENGTKRMANKSLLGLFRKALDEAMQRDPVQHIRETYQHILNNKDDDKRMNFDSLEKAIQKDPVQHIRETFQQIIDNEYDDKVGRENQKGPIQHMRETYQNILDDKYNVTADRERQKQDRLPWWKRFFNE